MVCVSPCVPLPLAMMPHCRVHVITEGVLGRRTTDVHVNLCVISSFVSAGLVLLLNPHNGKEIMSFSPEPEKFSGREVLCVVRPLRPPCYPGSCVRGPRSNAGQQRVCGHLLFVSLCARIQT